eukprot:6913784-Prymnesium_polylepis.1
MLASTIPSATASPVSSRRIRARCWPLRRTASTGAATRASTTSSFGAPRTRRQDVGFADHGLRGRHAVPRLPGRREQPKPRRGCFPEWDVRRPAAVRHDEEPKRRAPRPGHVSGSHPSRGFGPTRG